MAKFKALEERMDGSGTTSNALFMSQAWDPALASLFADSLGPVRSTYSKALKISQKAIPSAIVPRNPSEIRKTRDEVQSRFHSEDHAFDLQGYQQIGSTFGRDEPALRSYKRKRRQDDDDLEGRYMSILSQEEAKEDVKRQRERKAKRTRRQDKGETAGPESREISLAGDNNLGKDEQDSPETKIPQHETLASVGKKVELEKASRTVFFANISTAAIKSKTARRTLLDHLGSFLDTPAEPDAAHKVQSLRFRSTAFSTSGLPKKAAYAKKELMDSTTQSTNAYVVYTTQLAAKEAVKRLNGTVVLDRHLRADGVAQPAKIDHRRCVFVGNLSFVDDESMINAAQDDENDRKPRKAKVPADAEEGLWRQFSKAGVVESVRVIRDKTTRVGKGFAYVQFQDANAVEKALLYHEKRFPPMLPRILRVTRAKSVKNSATPDHELRNKYAVSSRTAPVFRRKLSAEAQSLSGRATRLLGRAGAARFKDNEQINHPSRKKVKGISKTPETIVFEGYRARSNPKKGAPKMGSSGKKQGKPRTRSSKRGAAFKASGGKKNRS